MCRHNTVPVARRIAITFDSRSCTYTTPRTTTGVLAYAPSVCAMGIRSGTVHATPRRDTFEAVSLLATSRVFARLPPGSDHPAATAGLPRLAGTGAPEPDPLLVPLPAVALVEHASGFELLGLPQPPTTAVAHITRHKHAVEVRQRTPAAIPTMTDRLLPAYAFRNSAGKIRLNSRSSTRYRRVFL